MTRTILRLVSAFAFLAITQLNCSGQGQVTRDKLTKLIDVQFTDPNADVLLFWDDSAGFFKALTLGTNLSITGTTINATAGGSGTVTSVGGTGTVSGLTLTGTVTTTGNLTLGGTLAGDDTPYDATSWNGSTAVPTKNAVRDKIEAMIAGGSFDGAFSSLTGVPTTITGYGITDFNSLGDARWVPTTRTVNGHALSSNVTVTPTDLSLVIGTNVQAWDADLDTWATKTPYAGTLTIATGKTFAVSNTLTLAGTDSSTLNIGTGGTLGTAAFTASGAYDSAGAAAAVASASVTGIRKSAGAGTTDTAATEGTDYYKPGGTDVAVADGGTGSSTAAGARTNLGATTVGSNLFTATNPSAITFPKVAADNTVSFRTPAQVLSDIGAQTSGSYLTSADIDTSAELAAILTNETGSGALVFGTSPTIATPKIARVVAPSDSASAVQITKADGSTAILDIDTSNGRVGIGTASPSAPLQISYSESGPGIKIVSLSEGDAGFEVDGNGDNANAFFFNHNSDHLGIGLGNESSYIQVTLPLNISGGDVSIDGGLTAASFSGNGSGLTGLPAQVISGSFSGLGVATTAFVVTIGVTQSGTTYKVNVTPTAALSAALFYISAKTTTTFTVTYLAGLSGTVTFDWAVFP